MYASLANPLYFIVIEVEAKDGDISVPTAFSGHQEGKFISIILLLDIISKFLLDQTFYGLSGS